MAALAPETLQRLRVVGTATLTMQLLKRGFRNVFVQDAKPLDPANSRFAAEAYTLRFIPMREDLSRPEVLGDPDYPPRKAIEDIPPGQVMVIDCRGDRRAGALGDILATRLLKRGCAAVVADGPMRDAAEVAKVGLPVFCNGSAAPASITVHFGADIGQPIACGGVAVFPGDVMVGDADGVVVVPRGLADEVARDGVEQELLESFLIQRVRDGHPTIGTYPPNEATLAAYNEWRAARDKT